MEVLSFAAVYGDEEALSVYEIKEQTLSTYLHAAKKRGLKISGLDRSKVIRDILNTYDKAELRAIALGGRVLPGMNKVPKINFSGNSIKLGVLSDTHIGSKYFSEERLDAAYREFEREKVEIVVHSGDVTEGMSNRLGHIYELSHLGYDQQKTEAVKQIEKCPVPIYMIDGNHDRWFMKSNGALIVGDIAKAVEHATFLGHDEGDIPIGNTTIKLWHGEDGNSYAFSYRLQKIVESFTGGEKPGVLIAGHTHKALYMFNRHIHVISAASIQSQTPWMRSKRIAAHTGFWIIEIFFNDTGVSRFKQELYPFYH